MKEYLEKIQAVLDTYDELLGAKIELMVNNSDDFQYCPEYQRVANKVQQYEAYLAGQVGGLLELIYDLYAEKYVGITDSGYPELPAAGEGEERGYLERLQKLIDEVEYSPKEYIRLELKMILQELEVEEKHKARERELTDTLIRALAPTQEIRVVPEDIGAAIRGLLKRIPNYSPPMTGYKLP